MCFGTSSKKKMEKAVEEMNRRRRAHLEALAAECEEDTKRILERYRERPPGFGYPGPTEAQPHLFIGSLYDALDKSWLTAQHITHAVNATQAELPSGDGVRRHWVRLDDDQDADIFPHFRPTCAFLDEALASDGRVLVHCEQGISRSATLLTAYAMRKARLPALAALVALRKQRQMVDPNPGFLKALVHWEAELRLDRPASTLEALQAVCAPVQRVRSFEVLPEEDVPIAAWRVRSRSQNDLPKPAASTAEPAPSSSWRIPTLRSNRAQSDAGSSAMKAAGTMRARPARSRFTCIRPWCCCVY